jgi:molybdopterin converting factor small subunit
VTNKLVMRTPEEFMNDYVPVYQPLYPLLMKKSQAYSQIIGQVDFKNVKTVGDIRAKHITPKDTEIAQVAVADGKKTFKKYFLGNQYTQSMLQDLADAEQVVAQVLDEHQKQQDELALFGDSQDGGTTVVNNGLIYSLDENYTLLAAGDAIAAGDSRLALLHAKIMKAVRIAKKVPGEKAIVVYGSTILDAMDSLYEGQAVSFREVLEGALGEGISIAEIPDEVAPAGNGLVIVNLDQIKTHYVALPKVDAQGENQEKRYVWTNFLMGSMMIECLVKNAIVRQPITFA